jgi:hypothetical protein
MATLLTHAPRRSPALWACLTASALLLLACTGGSDAGALDTVDPTGSDGSANPSFDSPLCGGQVVPSGDDDLTFGGYNGDLAFKIQDWTAEEFNLITGASRTLFSIDNHADGVVNAFVVDDSDLYAITDAELYRYDRKQDQLSLVSRAPDFSVEPSLGTTTFAAHVDLSSTQVLTQPYSRQMTAAGDSQLDVYLGLFARPGGDLNLVPLNRRDLMSYAGDSLYFVQNVVDDSGFQQNEIDLYDPSSDSVSPLVSGYEHYAFVGDTLWYTLSDTDSTYSLYRVPVQGGDAELVQGALAAPEFVANGTKLYFLQQAATSGGANLTELDPTNDALRSLGTCNGLLVYASATAAYIFQSGDTSIRAVRVPF